MVLETIYGVKILGSNDKKFCEFIFIKGINSDTILSILEDVYLNLEKDQFTFEVLKKNQSIFSWNFWDNYIWTKISMSKFNNFIRKNEEFVIDYYE